MARIFMTGFEDGSVNAFSASNNSSASTSQYRTGAYSMLQNNSGANAAIAFSSSKSEIYMRFGLYGALGVNATFVSVFDSAGAVQLRFRVTSINGVTLFRSNWSNNISLAASSVSLVANAWNCIEIYVKIDNSVGRAIFKVNGGIGIDFTGDTQDTANANMGGVWFGNPLNYTNNYEALTAYYDDIAINDTSGAVNNSWIGQGGIRLAFVDGNSAAHVPDMTPSVGSNWSCVDERPASDTDYVSDATVDAYDLYTLDTSSMPAAGTVSAVRWIARAKVDVDGANITPVIRSGVTTEQQADIPLSTSYVVKSLIMEVDPIDDAAWTVAKVNALEIGMAVG